MPLTMPQYAPVGALVYSGYWREQYRVLAHNDNGSITVRWETGSSVGETRTHYTAMDWQHDRILGQQGVITCNECWDTGACNAHHNANIRCGRCSATGKFITRVENGVPKGPGGPCFRCNGKGHHTEADRRRNNYHDQHQTVRI
jgi:hypothetical protein